MVFSPKTFLKNLFEMLINLTRSQMGPIGVRGKQSLLACYIDTCSKKIQSEIIIQIKTELRAIFKNW